MSYLRFTYVDATTGIRCDQAPCRHGPAPPPVVGLTYLWAPENQYQTARPVFYGECPDDADTTIPGVLAVLAEAEYAEALADEIAYRRTKLHEQRRANRNRIEMGGFGYVDRRIDSDRDSVQRIAHAAALAMQAIAAGVPWSVDWTCADDSELTLDAGGMLGMQAALATHSAMCHVRSRVLREQIDAAATLNDLAAIGAEIETWWPQ